MCPIAIVAGIILAIAAVVGAGLGLGIFFRWIQRERRWRGKVRLWRDSQEQAPERATPLRLVPRQNVEGH